jgi:uncharacterized membrane protein
MLGKRSAVPILFILLFSTWGSALSSASINDSESDIETNPQIISPTSQMSQFTDVVASSYELRDISRLIHSPLGSFDPLSDPIPLGPENLFDPSAILRTEMVVVQSNDADMTDLYELLDLNGFSVLDVIPDSALVVRLPVEHLSSSMKILQESNSVRWVGELPIAWRVSNELSELAGRSGIIIDLDITPASDLSAIEISELETDLKMVSNNDEYRSVCDFHLCQIHSVDAAWLPILAMDGRILSIDSASVLVIHNDNARSIAGIDSALSLSDMTLNGSGEVLAISDTGLDADHGDFSGRVRAIYNQFGPDNSHLDRNSGHGTHVTATLLGDGSGSSQTTGVVPAASFHFYQLEADSSGILARWGSLYDMFSHSWQQSARIQTNSWGNENLVGEYSSDSRSADTFLVDYPRFIVLFSAGELGENGYQSITPPGTAKNVITVGASTTGSYGTEAIGAVADFSSQGTTLDGRIKPDLVAPGVMICSARAEEAQFISGLNCTGETHLNGVTPLYTTMNGSSMATAVVAGGATMVRQYLRDVESISEPRSDLIKAILINGAEDIGAENIPNAMEGWGQIDLSNSLYPQNSGQNLDIIFDDSRELLPGHSFIYTIENSGDGTNPLDFTIVWNDAEGSATGNQSSTRLVNDLDLIVTAPDGSVYYGNSFINGFSTTSGSADRLNNVERVQIENGVVGTWSVEIGHAGGSQQGFALVLSGMVTETVSADLTTFPGSLSTSVLSPLQGDTFLVETAWRNQAAGATGAYSIEVEDLTTGSILLTQQKSSLAGGSLDSLSFPHSFSTTGIHTLELRLDSNSEVTELNDELNGINNNIIQLDVYVSQIGVRLTPLMENGNLPINAAELALAKHRTLNPSSASHVIFELELKNEGTSEVTVDISASPIQLVGDGGLLHQPQDEWWKIFNESGPWVLAPFGDVGDRIIISLNFSDIDADFSNPAGPQYAIPGTFVSQLNLWDKNAPTISHSIELTTEVERVEGLFTVVAGTDNLGAQPGDFAIFSLSIRNTGNGPTQYTVSCETENHWISFLGSSQSPVLTIEPLARLQFLPLPVKIKVPNDIIGQPLAGSTELVTCTTESVNDPSLSTIENAIVEVFENHDFIADIYDEGVALGAMALAAPRPVLNDESVSTELIVSNLGNVPLQFTVSATSSQNSWPIQLVQGSTEVIGEDLSISIPAGGIKSIFINTIVPLSASMGISNVITIRTTLEDGPTITNGTKLIVQELALLDIENPEILDVALGLSSVSAINVQNIGNVPLSISLTMGSLAAGWSGGFLSGKNFEMDMNRHATISVGLDLPGNLPVGMLDEEISVIIEAQTPSGEIEIYTIEMGVNVVPSIWMSLSVDNINLEEIDLGTTKEFEINISNIGNVPTSLELGYLAPDGWDVVLEHSNIDNLAAGDSVMVTINIRPDSISALGLTSITFYSNSTNSELESWTTNAILELEMSRSRDEQCSGLSCIFVSLGLPRWTLALIFVVALVGLIIGGLNMRRSSDDYISSDEELIPKGSALLSGSTSERRAAALDTSRSGDVVTGGVSDSEVNAALSASLPGGGAPITQEGTAPLPLSGLPEGWTMDQWVAYGHLWWEQNQP